MNAEIKLQYEEKSRTADNQEQQIASLNSKIQQLESQLQDLTTVVNDQKSEIAKNKCNQIGGDNNFNVGADNGSGFDADNQDQELSQNTN